MWPQVLPVTVGPLRGVWPSTQEWFAAARRSENLSAQVAEQYQYWEFHPNTRIESTPPKGIEAELHPVFQTDLVSQLPGTFVCQFPQGRVLGRNGAVVAPDGYLLGDVFQSFQLSPTDYAEYRQLQFPAVKVLSGKTAVLATTGGNQFFHWIFDVLPRLHLLEQRYDIADIDWFVIPDTEAAYARDTLALLGIPPEKCLKANRQLHVRAEVLLLPSLAGSTNHPSAWACQFLRDRFLLEPSHPPHRRIYVSRQNSRRKAINGETLETLLTSWGFVTVELEKLPFSEQVRLFSEATAVVALHGAGLSNLVFCSPGTKVIELFSSNYVKVLYWHLSDVLDLDYYYAIGQGSASEDGSSIDPIIEDVRLDLDRVEQTLALAGLRPLPHENRSA